jgi:hypothetical protein
MKQTTIDTFFGYFRQEMNTIESFERLHYRKILICVFLDTLAKAVFPNVTGNKKRFTEFLNRFSSWPYWKRVAAFQLSYQLESHGLVAGTLSEAVSQLIHTHPPYSVVRAQNEPEVQTILPYASTDVERGLIQKSTYVNLFYLLRNCLVHEGREPGGAYEFINRDSEPKYMNLTRFDDANRPVESKELLFPYTFMRKILEECIDASHAHFSQISVDPRSGFSMSSVW